MCGDKKKSRLILVGATVAAVVSASWGFVSSKNEQTVKPEVDTEVCTDTKIEGFVMIPVGAKTGARIGW